MSMMDMLLCSRPFCSENRNKSVPSV